MADFKIDTSGVEAALEKMRDWSRRDFGSVVLPDQAQNLISGVGGLYQEARKHTPKTIADIKGLKTRLGYAIKTWRFAGHGMKKKAQIILEIKRRLKLAGYYQSTGWLNRVYALRGKGSERQLTVRNVGKPRGQVRQRLVGLSPFITLTNFSKGAAEFANKTGYVQSAINNRQKSILIYVQRKMDEAAKKAFG